MHHTVSSKRIGQFGLLGAALLMLSATVAPSTRHMLRVVKTADESVSYSGVYADAGQCQAAKRLFPEAFREWTDAEKVQIAAHRAEINQQFEVYRAAHGSLRGFQLQSTKSQLPRRAIETQCEWLL